MKAPLIEWMRTLLSQQKAPVAEVAPTFPAVEIDPGLHDCCDVVRELRGRRFLMTSAPPIPLPGCDVEKCGCRYARFTDRRQQTRRGDDIGIANALYSADDKREGSRGRRAGESGQDSGQKLPD